jgi:Arc/MetJ family transcription regulator
VEVLIMATNLAIDDRLIDEARRIGKKTTKKAAVTEALEEYIQRRRQLQVLELFGTIDVDPDFDYKQQRMRP